MTRALPITGATRLAAVIGDPARHSLSPAIHNAAFDALGLDSVFLAFDVPRGQAPAALEAVRTFGLVGLSVTMPHKADVAAAVDELDDTASALEAVNCVVPVGGRLIGTNTDGEGFVRGLQHDAGIDPGGRRCVVLGAGGAARAIVLALARTGAESVTIVNRTAASAEVAAQLGAPVARVGVPADIARADLVVNATSVGMGAGAGDLPCDPDLFGPDQIVVDIIYNPFETALLRSARKRGALAFNGLSMLVFQAAVAFERWTDHPAPVPAMLTAVQDQLAAEPSVDLAAEP